MEKLKRVKKRLDTLSKALKNLDKAIIELNSLENNNRLYEFIRESVITRFEYTLELLWKCLKSYLEDVEGLIVPSSPRGVIIEAKNNSLITSLQAQYLNDMVDDRNLSSHVYHEDIASKIVSDVLKYYLILQEIKNKIEEKLT